MRYERRGQDTIGQDRTLSASKRVHRTPGFHVFISRRLGDPRHPVRFLRNFFLGPLCSRSFGEFWRLWNPIFGYVLIFFIYRPLRRRMPRPVALYLTFLASGFLLHDLPFNLSADLYRGRLELPAVTLLFAVFGALALLSEGLRIDLSRFPPWTRAASNLGWLTAGYGLRHVLLILIRG